MSRGLTGPGPHDRMQPSGRRTADGVRVGAGVEDREDERVVLSVLVKDEPGVLAEVTALFARRQINIERVVSEKTGDGEHTRIMYVVEPSHPGVNQVMNQLAKVMPVVSVEETDGQAEQYLSASRADS